MLGIFIKPTSLPLPIHFPIMSHPVNRLLHPTDIAPLAVFRILMGLLMSAEGFGAILTGWVRANYVDAPFAFNFIGFDFLEVLVGPQAYLIYGALGVAGLGIALGYRYRLSIGLYTVIWAAVYFGQKTSYNNHYYLLLLMCILLWIVPANRFESLDVRQGRTNAENTTPYLHIFVFKFLLLIVYVYAAFAKLYPDWLDGTTVRIFLSSKSDWPVLGPLTGNDAFIYAIAYGGILFDFFVIPALWYRKTRPWAFGVSIFFHLFNSIVFQIGIFPYMMLITSVLFFDASTIRRVFRIGPAKVIEPEISKTESLVSPGKMAFLIVFFGIMVALPLRHFFIPGCVHWTEEGHRLAWHMMLRSKYGYIEFIVKKPDDSAVRIHPADYMSEKMANGMATRPDIIWQYAQRLKKEFRDRGEGPVEIYAVSQVSLNGYRLRPLIDPEADLAETRWRFFGHQPWIVRNPDLDGNTCRWINDLQPID